MHYRGNRYFFPLEIAGTTVTLTHQTGNTTPSKDG